MLVFFVVFLNGNIYFTQKLAAIPVTAFVGEESTKDFEKYIRLCFIKVNTQSVNKHSTSKIIQWRWILAEVQFLFFLRFS